MNKTNRPIRACNSCGARDTKLRFLKNGYNIVECQTCHLVYAAEEVTRAELEEYYDEGYYHGDGRAYSDYLAFADARKSFFHSIMPALKRNLSPEAKKKPQIQVLDVGCAAGYFLEVAQEVGWKAQGVELSPYMSTYAREERGLNVFTGTLEDMNLPPGSFDIVTMWDVIEHVQDPQQMLRRAHELLVTGGLLVVATGDIDGVTARFYGKKWALLGPPGHLFYFSRRTLSALLQKIGFQIMDWESDGAFLSNHRIENPRGWKRVLQNFHDKRLVHAVTRRLKWGSIMTIYARKSA